MQIFGIRTPVIRPGDHLVDVILDSLQKQNEAIEEKDMLAIASKVVATTQGRFIRLSSVNPSERARELAEKYRMDSSFVEVVVVEADKIFGGASGALLTLKDGLLVPNAGVDGKNAPQGSVALWPEDAQGSAEQIRRGILEKTGKKVGVLIVDSQVTPLRMGTKGVALG
ncbi:coenzyme F420-0:L-glutamate ligase, partial [Candidatus Bathyarchaeota archaeon]|nr:coenzyme F420-0:L-glutamate ligase [Candidatus Bathyarchaeota archaeon]NIR15102.1 coenzyme F420-0:L-glutamate ligase [Desulfobacterales bacterium]NIU81588.1 coenzyme F420-0:L-glutamate ligase [Candidatus Bathyarchaeota archaeon]NIV68090.1 coenzyme F420-0:L-glutamate ligase [Candidatus Bathyarchaeota archaeon]